MVIKLQRIVAEIKHWRSGFWLCFALFSILYLNTQEASAQKLKADLSRDFMLCLDDYNDYYLSQNDQQLLKVNCLLSRAKKKALYEQGIYLADSAYFLLSLADDSSLVALYWERKALLLQLNGEFGNSAELFTQSIEYYSSHNQPQNEANGLVSIAEMYRSSGQFNLAKFHISQAVVMDAAGQIQEDEIRARLWHRYAAIVLEADKDIPNAILFSNRSLSFSEPLQLYDHMAISYLELGYVYYNIQDDRAEGYYQRAIDIWHQIGDIRSYANGLTNLCRLYYSQNKLEEALQTSAKLRTLFQKYAFKDLKQNVLEMEANIFAKTKNYRRAFYTLDSAATLDDSVRSEQFDRSLIEIGKKYQNELAMQQLKTSEVEKNQAIAEAENERFVKTAVIIALCFSAIIILLLVFLYRRLMRQNNSIQKQQEVIQKQNISLNQTLLQKQALLQEVHHRVKNNLQIITSMLNMQANAEHDVSTILSIRKAQQRVRAIAMIHEKLYKKEDLVSVNFHNYLVELTDQIKGATFDENFKVWFDIKSSDIELNIDIAIPLGLIINEIATNSLKYAFIDRDEGKISITFSKSEQGVYTLMMSDNGVGIPEERPGPKSGSLGRNLIDLLVRQLKAELKVSSNFGTHYNIQFYD
jgi:two-component sensor histidine kinase